MLELENYPVALMVRIGSDKNNQNVLNLKAFSIWSQDICVEVSPTCCKGKISNYKLRILDNTLTK